MSYMKTRTYKSRRVGRTGKKGKKVVEEPLRGLNSGPLAVNRRPKARIVPLDQVAFIIFWKREFMGYLEVVLVGKELPLRQCAGWMAMKRTLPVGCLNVVD